MPRRRTGLEALVLMAAIGGAAAGITSASQSKTEVVTLYATVEGTDGAPITGLTRDDFEILADGNRLPLFTFSSAPVPLRALLVGDLSTSVIGNFRTIWYAAWPDMVSTAADGLINNLAPEDQARWLAMLGTKLVPSPTWSDDRRTLARTLSVFIPPAGPIEPSPLWDAIEGALPFFALQPGRHVIVLITDGRSNGNRLSLREATERAMVANVAVSAVELRPRPQSLGLTRAEVESGPAQFLTRLTAMTGGLHEPVTIGSRNEFATAAPVVRILARMRSSYTLGIVPPIVDTTVRGIVVRVRTPGATVRVRQGYGMEAR